MSAPDRPSRFVGNSLSGQGGSAGPDAVQISEHLYAFALITARKGCEADVAAAMKQRFGLDLPQPSRVARSDRYAAIWLQPNGWLLQAPAGGGETFVVDVGMTLKGLASVVDQSHGRAALRIAGAHARNVLQKCCRLDFHPRVFAAGQSAATVVAHVSCVVHQVDDAPTYELIVGSTYSTWLIEDLTAAAAEFGWRFARAGT